MACIGKRFRHRASLIIVTIAKYGNAFAAISQASIVQSATAKITSTNIFDRGLLQTYTFAMNEFLRLAK
jgi:hypothetical protein